MPVLLVFVLASLISISRILVSNREALNSLVWAEDGLFPLCIQAHGYFQCLMDPYEGYLLFLSRTLALPVALFPQSTWPLVTNVVAALTFGFLSAVITWLLLRAQVSRTVSIGAGLSAVMLPIVGLEAINTAGSAYMLLLVVAAIAVSFTFNPKLPFMVVPITLFVAALTIPSSIVLSVPLIASLLTRREESVKRTLASIFALSLGLVIQFAVVATAANKRSVVITADSIKDWVQQYPKAFLSLLPQTSELGGEGRLSVPAYRESLSLGVIVLVAVGAIAVYLVTRRTAQLSGAGWLLITGFLIGTIPAISAYPNNRYLVVPVITLAIALFVIMGFFVKGKYSSLVVVIVVLAFIAWIPDFGASEVRSTASPFWSDSLVNVKEQCLQNPKGNTQFTFSPNWPFTDANFLGPTSNVVQCAAVQSPNPE